MSKTYVLDASAVIELLENGSGANRVAQLLRDADRSGQPLLASVTNWGEVFYLSWQRYGEQLARETLAELSQLPIRVIPSDFTHALKAAELKAIHHIPYVDCMAAALAAIHKATLVTADRDFEKLGRQFPILWIARA